MIDVEPRDEDALCCIEPVTDEALEGGLCDRAWFMVDVFAGGAWD